MFKTRKPTPYSPTPWELAVLETPPTKPVPLPLLRKITGDLAANDIRVVLESVNLALTSRNTVTQSRRRVLAAERYKHLESLKPFMDEEQLEKCIPADDAMDELADYFDTEDETCDDDEVISLSPAQVTALSTIRSQLLDLQSQLKAVAAGISDSDKACAVSDAAMAVDDVLMCLDEVHHPEND